MRRDGAVATTVEKKEGQADSLLTKIVAAVAVAGVLAGIGLVTRVEVLATRVQAIEAAQALRAEDGERLARIEQKLETLTNLVERLERDKRN